MLGLVQITASQRCPFEPTIDNLPEPLAESGFGDERPVELALRREPSSLTAPIPLTGPTSDA